MKKPNQNERKEMARLKARVDELMQDHPGRAGLDTEAVAAYVLQEYGVTYEPQEIADIWQTGKKLRRDR